MESYNAWVEWPCSGVEQCCPPLAELGGTCLNEVVQAAAAHGGAVLAEM